MATLDPPPKLRDGKQGGRRHGTVVEDDAPKKKPSSKRKRGNLNPLPAKTPHDAELIRPDAVVEDEEAVVIANGSRQVGPKEMRATLQSDIAASYDSVQRAILDALSAETSIWATCRQCSTRMKIAIPATAERLRAASLALDVFGKPPTAAAAEAAPDLDLTSDEIAAMSNTELIRALSRARPAPHKLSTEEKFRGLLAEVEETRDVIAKYEEGLDVSRRELRQASLRVGYWRELVAVLMPVIGVSFSPAEIER